jgi:hypothetical protein
MAEEATAVTIDPAAAATAAAASLISADAKAAAPGNQPADTGTATTWVPQDADAALRGHIETKGWNSMTPAEAAFAAAKAHKEAEAFVGAPADQMLRIPKPEDEAGTKAFWGKLGAPDDAAKYDFAGIKFSDGKDLQPEFVQKMQAAAFAQHLPQTAAQAMVKEVVGYLEGTKAAETAETTASLQAAQTALKQNWGSNYEANMFVARRAAQALGVPVEAVAALESQVGYDKVMEMFRQIGTKIGEDAFVRNLNPNVPGVMSRDQAVAQLDQLKADDAWVKRYLDGGAAERRQMDALTQIIAG